MRNRSKFVSAVRIGGCALAGFYLSSCADGPSDPSPRKLKAPTSVSRTLSQDNGSQIVVRDEYGRALTLDIPSREIRTSDNEIILLTPEQAADALTNFQNTVYYDQAAEQIATWGGGGGCGESGCVEPTLVTPNPSDQAPDQVAVSGSATPNPLVQVSVTVGPKHKSVTGTFGTRIVSVSEPRRVKQAKNKGGQAGLGDAIAFNWPDDCVTMRGQILLAATAYRERRRITLGTLWDIAKSSLPEIDEYGRIVVRIPTAQGTGLALENSYWGQAYSQTKLNIMAVMYTTAGCGTVNWGQQGSSTRGGFALVCHSEYWTVTLGDVSRTVTAEVCEYTQS